MLLIQLLPINLSLLKFKNNMKNTPVKLNDQTFWISRSLAVSCVVFAYVDNQLSVLANQRGPAVSKPYLWNCPSGYLDYDETLLNAAIRETFEETGLNLNYAIIHPPYIKLMEIDDDINRTSQNVIARFSTLIHNPDDFTLTNEYSEPNEVLQIKWIPLTQLDNYQWSSDTHKAKIQQFAKQYIRNTN